MLVTLDDRMTLSEAAKLLGKSPSCIWRWARDGVAGERLAHLYIGGTMYTSRAALEDFGRRVAAAKLARGRAPGRAVRPRRHRRPVAGV